MSPLPGSLSSLLSRFWDVQRMKLCLPHYTMCQVPWKLGDKNTVQHDTCPWEALSQLANGTVFWPFLAILRRGEPFRSAGSQELPSGESFHFSNLCPWEKEPHFQFSLVLYYFIQLGKCKGIRTFRSQVAGSPNEEIPLALECQFPTTAYRAWVQLFSRILAGLFKSI